MRAALLAAAALAGRLLFAPAPACASSPEYGGTFETRADVYARRPNRSDARAPAAALFQLWTRGTLSGGFRWRASWEGGIDTHGDFDRGRWLDAAERGLRRPAGSLGELYVEGRIGRLDLRAGKQEIRWGRADGFNPTDNLVPYDYLDLFSERRMAVPAVKTDFYAGGARIEGVWLPVFHPTRLPLLGQRWFPAAPSSARLDLADGPVDVALSYRDGTIAFPARTLRNSQWAVRYNQLVPGAELSVSYFDGFDDLPFFRPRVSSGDPTRAVVTLDREYHRVRVAGADFAAALGRFGVRGEAAYFDRRDPENRDHFLFVVGVDRTWGDWSAIVQYAGQKVTDHSASTPTFPDLGLRSTAIFRLERTLSPSRSFELRGAVRLRDGDFLLEPLYTVALSNHWRLRIGATLLGGPEDGFLGQYRSSSRARVELRYSF